MDAWESVLLLFAAFVAAGLGWFVHRAAPDQRGNRALATLLVLEGVTQASLAGIFLATPSWVDVTDRPPNGLVVVLDAVRILAILFLIVAYLRVLAMLDTGVTRWLRARAVIPVASALALGLGLFLSIGEGLAFRRGEAFDTTAVYPLYALAGIFALVCMLAYVTRAMPSSQERRKAKAFALAFGVRDVATVAGFAVWFVPNVGPGPGQFDVFRFYVPIVGIGTLLFVSLLAYAVLRTQLFDIDLKIKIGIRRGTFAAISVTAVFIAFQVAQQYLNKTYGIVASGIVTGALVFLAPRLNKFADKVSDAALPNVSATPEYFAFKKLEIYRAALEGAFVHGSEIGPRERAVLERLRAKLEIAEADASALERELAPPASATRAVLAS